MGRGYAQATGKSGFSHFRDEVARGREVLAQSQESVACCLGAAMRADELPPTTDAMELAKTQRSPAAIRVIFASVLAR